MGIRVTSIAVWAAAFCFLCFATLTNAHNIHQAHSSRGRIHRRANVITKAPAWAKEISQSPGHQNPVIAPPDVTVELDLSKDSATSLEQYYKDAKNHTESADVSPNKSHQSRRSLEKRGSGPLYCKDGPCADDSCCGPEGICGYGPDYCGKGCSSKCDAKAMCGEHSEDSEMPCGMNLCCSASGWCGTTEVFCDNADPLHKTLPCQAGYGSCNIASSPSCSQSGSTNGRTIGYYQSWNVRARKCDTKTPKQLNTKGFTHLFYSFAFIDPVSFKVTPAHNDDVKQMREFTDLSKAKDSKLQTWIAIGGFDFSNEETPTHTTWSDMVSSKANRAAFIESVRAYMDEYGFQGVDLDWEYPGEPKRGGRKLADTRNFSLLLKEMRASYGSKYGISLTLAPDYWYLRWFDAKAMEPYVDFFGFMAYDLHGYWDEDVKTLGKIIRGQADIREIGNNTIPLWFDGLDPKKLNFGLALYGRGYTVANKNCNDLGCSFAGPSKKGECTDSDGVMSLGEIKSLIKKGTVKSTYNKETMMKQITWDDQWIGYDDEETFAAKKAWADTYCFGGTMIWSIDFQADEGSFGGGSGSGGGSGGGTVPALPGGIGGTIPDSLKNKKLPDCVNAKTYETHKDKGKFWFDSGAEQWTEDYINSLNDHSQWAQKLYVNLFDDVNLNDFICDQPGAKCDFKKSCKDFNDIGLGGLYYMFQSMSAFFQYMDNFHNQLDAELSAVAEQIHDMTDGLNIGKGAPEPLDIAAILGAAFSIISAGATPVPAVGGPLAGLSGIMYMISGTAAGAVSPDEAATATETIRSSVSKIKKSGTDAIATVIGAVFGRQGQSQNAIPEGMRVGDAKYKNPAVRVFGWGSWVKDNPLDGLTSTIKTMRSNLDKALLWQMGRRWRGLYVVVRDDLPKPKCTNRNNAWDDSKGRCLDILAWYPKEQGKTFGGNTDIYFAWDEWGMDKLATLRNTVACWENSGGKIGEMKTDVGALKTSNPYDIPCFFVMPTLKGNYSDIQKGSLWMAGDFAGQDGQAGRLWPKSRCAAENNKWARPTEQGHKCSSLDATDDLS
ncbi:hypothetical protein ACHAQK_009156 [Fusarium lateritium]